MIIFIDANTRDCINMWAMSNEGKKWIHSNIDYPQVRNMALTAISILNKHNHNVSEDQRFEAINILAKTANQVPGKLARLEAVLKNGGDYSALLAEAEAIQSENKYYHGPKVALVAKAYENNYRDPNKQAALDRAHVKVGRRDFDPVAEDYDADVLLAKSALANGRNEFVSARDQARLRQKNDPAIQRLQETLNTLHYTDAHDRPLVVDGRYGPSTKHAIETFQRDKGLSVDGIAGPNTWSALQEATRVASIAPTMAPTVPSATAAEPSAVTFPRMAPSSDLDAVTLRALQQHLNTLGITDHHGQALSTTGVYDESTRTAVMTFQLEQRLPGTGAADPATRALIEARAHIVELQQASRAHPELTHDAWLQQGHTHAPIMSSPSLPHTPPAATSPVTEQAPNGADPHNASMLEQQQRLDQQRIQHQIVQEHQRLHDQAMQQREQEQKAAQEPQNTAAFRHEAAPNSDRLRDFRQPDDSMHQRALDGVRYMEDRQTIPHEDHRERLTTALWTPESPPPPRVPAIFADPDHPKHYRYEILLEQVQDAPALRSYTADQHARIAAGLTFVTDQHKAFVIQDMSSIEVKGSTLIATDHLKIGQASEILHGNLSTMLAKTPEETASVWREWALPKQATLPEAAQAVASDPHVVSRTDMRHPQESHHPMFLDARRKLGATYAHHGMTRDPEQLDREAALVTVTLRDRQMEAVPTLMLACEPDGRFSTRPGLCAVSDFNMVKLSGEDLTQAPPVARSSQTLVQVEQRLHEQAVAFQQQWAQQAGLGRTP